MLRSIIICLIAIFILIIPAVAQQPLSARLHYMNSAPRIDGILENGEWEQAQIAEFRDINGGNNYKNRTVGHMGYNSQWLFLAFECFDPNLPTLIRNKVNRDDSVWDDDSIEVFLDPNGERATYYQFVVNSKGVQYDGCGFDSKWDCYWVAQTSTQSKMWQLEIAIPLSSFNVHYSLDKLKPGMFTANFFRSYRPRTPVEEITGWSPSGGNFHRPEMFGSLTNVVLSKDPTIIDSKISLELPNKWYSSNNKIKVILNNTSSNETAVNLYVVDVNGFKLVKRTASITLKPKKQLIQVLAIPSNLKDNSQLQVVAILSYNPKHVLASSSLFTIQYTQPLSAKMLYPSFRNSVMSKDPDKRLWISCDVGDVRATSLRIDCNVYKTGSQQVICNSTIPAKPKQRVMSTTDVSALKPGDYNAKIQLITNNNNIIAHQEFAFTVLQPSDFEVSFDRKRICRINGKPFFPIGLYHVGEAMINILNSGRKPGIPEITIESAIKDVAEHGFNAVIDSWAVPNENYFKLCKANGLYAIAEMGAVADEQAFRRHLAFVNQYDNFLMWYTVDEPMGEKLKLLEETYKLISRNDQYRPAASAVCNPAVFDSAAPYMDILIPDAYVIHPLPIEKRASFAGLRGWDLPAMASGNGAKPMWSVPQAFELKSSGIFGRPTPEELRCQAYTHLAFGATGFIWYTYATAEPEPSLDHGIWYTPETELWPAFKELNKEILAFSKIIIDGEYLGEARTSSAQILSGAWSCNSKTYMLLVNPERKSIDFTVTGLKGKQAKSMFGSKTKTVLKGGFKESLKSLECIIYILDNVDVK